MTAAQVAHKINTPVNLWLGRCHEIANELLLNKLISGTLMHGYWIGPVKEGTFFYKIYCATPLGFVRHGWVKKDNDNIVDPTRWLFEDKKPYIFDGPDKKGYYDVDGSKLRKLLKKSPPIFRNKERKIKPSIIDESVEYALTLLGHPHFTKDGLFWIANQSLSILGNYAPGIFNFIKETGLEAFIPIGNLKIAAQMEPASYGVIK